MYWVAAEIKLKQSALIDATAVSNKQYFFGNLTEPTLLKLKEIHILTS